MKKPIISGSHVYEESITEPQAKAIGKSMPPVESSNLYSTDGRMARNMMRLDYSLVSPGTLFSKADYLRPPIELLDRILYRLNAVGQQSESSIVKVDMVFQKRLEVVEQLH